MYSPGCAIVATRWDRKWGHVLVYCKSGVRSKKACNRLMEQGVEARRLYNLDGGILRWQNDVDRTMPNYVEGVLGKYHHLDRLPAEDLKIILVHLKKERMPTNLFLIRYVNMFVSVHTRSK